MPFNFGGMSNPGGLVKRATSLIRHPNIIDVTPTAVEDVGSGLLGRIGGMLGKFGKNTLLPLATMEAEAEANKRLNAPFEGIDQNSIIGRREMAGKAYGLDPVTMEPALTQTMGANEYPPAPSPNFSMRDRAKATQALPPMTGTMAEMSQMRPDMYANGDGGNKPPKIKPSALAPKKPQGSALERGYNYTQNIGPSKRVMANLPTFDGGDAEPEQIKSDDLPDFVDSISGVANKSNADGNPEDMNRDMQQSSAGGKQSAFDKYMAAVSDFPTREKYKPSIWRRIAAGALGAATGMVEGPSRGYAAAVSLNESPYNNAVRDKVSQLNELEPLMRAENQREMNQTRVNESARKTNLISKQKQFDGETNRLLTEGKLKNQKDVLALKSLKEAHDFAIANDKLDLAEQLQNQMVDIRKRAVGVAEKNANTNARNADTNARRAGNQERNTDSQIKARGTGKSETPAQKAIREMRIGKQVEDEMTLKVPDWYKIISDEKNPRNEEVRQMLDAARVAKGLQPLFGAGDIELPAGK